MRSHARHYHSADDSLTRRLSDGSYGYSADDQFITEFSFTVSLYKMYAEAISAARYPEAVWRSTLDPFLRPESTTS